MLKPILALSLAVLTVAPVLHAQKQSQQQQYGVNIIRINPIKAMDIGVGPGMSYERILGSGGKVGIILPISLLLQNNNYDGYYNGDNAHYLTYLYFTPGIKFYPAGQKNITYAIGANLMLGYGGGDVFQNSYNGPTPTYPPMYRYRTQIFRLGIIVNNYVNFQITPAFNLGISAGLGVRYLDHETRDSGNNTTTYNHPMSATGQFTLSIGYRF